MKTASTFSLPKLDLEQWEKSKTTLNLYLQVVGKIQLALMPRKNHWWNITFLLNSKGLITHVMQAGDLTFEIQFNFLDHKVEMLTSNGDYESFALTDGLSVAEFYRHIMSILTKRGIGVKIIAHPYSIPDANPITTPFNELTEFKSYDAEYVQRFWRIMVWTGSVLNEFGGRFYGKTSPVQLFWHHMDLAMTRFCGRRAPKLPSESNIANKDAYSHELISFGFWAGDEKVRGAAYYSYTYPSPPGIDKKKLSPSSARWTDSNGSPLALLMYDDLLAEPDPHKALLDFLESCYNAGATMCDWDIADLTVTPLKEM
jgi:hypothetical protein